MCYTGKSKVRFFSDDTSQSIFALHPLVKRSRGHNLTSSAARMERCKVRVGYKNNNNTFG